MDSELQEKFPNLTWENHDETSEEDYSYTCIAWAAGRGPDEGEWWEPSGFPWHTWPPSAGYEYTTSCYMNAFRTLGYEPCDNGQLEAGWQKVALYVDQDNVPTHMARQLSNGKWTSKLGSDMDISHDTVEVLEGPCYGTASYYLRRRNTDPL